MIRIYRSYVVVVSCLYIFILLIPLDNMKELPDIAAVLIACVGVPFMWFFRLHFDLFTILIPLWFLWPFQKGKSAVNMSIVSYTAALAFATFKAMSNCDGVLGEGTKTMLYIKFSLMLLLITMLVIHQLTKKAAR